MRLDYKDSQNSVLFKSFSFQISGSSVGVGFRISGAALDDLIAIGVFFTDCRLRYTLNPAIHGAGTGFSRTTRSLCLAARQIVSHLFEEDHVDLDIAG